MRSFQHTYMLTYIYSNYMYGNIRKKRYQYEEIYKQVFEGAPPLQTLLNQNIGARMKMHKQLI